MRLLAVARESADKANLRKFFDTLSLEERKVLVSGRVMLGALDDDSFRKCEEDATAWKKPRATRGCRWLSLIHAGGQSAARGWQHHSGWACARAPRSRVASSPIPTRGLTIGERRVLLADHRVQGWR